MNKNRGLSIDQYVSFKCFSEVCSYHNDITKLVRAFMNVIGMNGLNLIFLDILIYQGLTLRVNLWPQASKNSPKQVWASKKRPQLVLQGQ